MGREMGRGRKRGAVCDERGQSTVEYLVVLLAILSVAIGLSAFLRLGSDGTLARLASNAASHAVGGTSDPSGAFLDVLLY